MMYGSFLYNCWAALIGFTIYFIAALQVDFPLPLPILLGSFATAAVVFLLAYPLRYLLGYILYTPEPVPLLPLEEEAVVQEREMLDLPSLDQTSAMEFEDENAEEIAQVVRTMMHREENQSVQNV